MSHEVRTRKLVGSPHTRHSLQVDGVEIYATICEMSEREIAERVHLHHNPPPPRPFRLEAMTGKNKGGRPKKATVNERGFSWQQEPEEL
jgi:hypothetical protein